MSIKIYGIQRLTLLDFPDRVACTIFLGGCNFACPYCHNGSLVKMSSDAVMNEEELMTFLKSRLGRLQGVCVSGGEPTLHPELIELMKRIKSLGFQIKLDTNGTNPEMLKRLIADGLVDYVAMDIKNSPDKYAKTVGLGECGIRNSECRIDRTELLIEKVKESAAILMEGRVDFEFRTTLTREMHSIDDMESIGRWLSGEEKYFLQTYREEGEQLVGGLTPFTAEQTGELLDALRRYIPNAQSR